MQIQTAGIIGHGAFGALLHTLTKRFLPTLTIKIHSHKHAPDNETFFSLAEVARCDVVVLAVPIHAFEEVLTSILPHVGADTVIVDVATVKVHTVQLLRALAAGKRWIATHPVWGPESYEKKGGDISGFRIVMCDGTLSTSEYTTATDWLKSLGFDVVEMSAKDHDKHIANTLFLTHFIAQMVSRAGIKRTPMDTISFGWLMNAVETVGHDQELFKDVYKYNPYCKEVLERLGIGEADVHKLLI